MYRTGIKVPCRARHMLVGDFKPEEVVPHGHEYLIEWICTVSDSGCGLAIPSPGAFNPTSVR